MKKSSNISIYDVAENAEVSVSTVSRVLNSDSRISRNTASKVKQVMSDLNYTPAPAAKRRGNRMNNKKKISYKLAFYTESYCHHKLIEGINEFALENGHEFHSISNSSAIYRPEDMLNKPFDGIMFFRFTRRLLDSQIPYKTPSVRVFGPHRPELSNFDHVSYNAEQITIIAADYLESKGFKEFGVYYANGYYAADHRVNLFKMHSQMKNARVTDLGFKNEADGYSPIPTEAVRKLVKEKKAPYGIFAYNDRLAVCLHMQLVSLGLKAGKDFMLISCDNDSEALRPLLKRPATIDLKFKEIGARAAEQLIWRIEHQDAPVQSIFINPNLIEP
jgi:LacI family transcriptional regulator